MPDRDGKTREAFIESARELVPALRDRAEAAEANRRLPDETHQDFVDAGFYRLFQPGRYGGYELDFGLMIDVAAEIGRGCGSSCWIFTNLASQSWINGMHDPRAQEDLWGENDGALIASAFPAMKPSVQPVEGGFVVGGTWSFSSGIDFADWINIQFFVPRADGPPIHCFALVPKSDYEVIDDWFVTGLAATGSRSLRLEEVFIPAHRVQNTANIRGGPSPGSAINPGPLYRLPLFSIGVKLFSGTAIGIARGAVELIEDNMRQRTSSLGINLAEQQTVHVRIAESAAEIDAAWALMQRDCADAMRLSAAEIEPTLDQRVTWRRNDAFAGQLSVRAVERLYNLTGGRGLSATSPFQRAWRDVHASIQQIFMSWDLNAVNYGKVRLGLELTDVRL